MFILERFIYQYGIATRKKKNSGYELVAIDGLALPNVDSETMPLLLTFQKYNEKVILDIVPIARYDIVLGTPQLEKYNPNIDQRKRVLTFKRYSYVTNIYPRYRQRSIIDKERQFYEIEY